jgi:hypothetical protein
MKPKRLTIQPQTHVTPTESGRGVIGGNKINSSSAPKVHLMRFVMLFILLGVTPLLADDWTPPKNPDPQAILQEARADTRAKRYKIALAKHVWFHEYALIIEPALYGVRLSFALSDWLELAEKYPPALAKLKKIRDAARRNVMAGKNVRESFHDMASINYHLGEQSATKKTFEALDQKNPKTAEEVFDLAQPSLVIGKAYALIFKYISPKEDFAKMVAEYLRWKKLDQEFANKRFANASTTLVAILVLNDCKKEAEEIAASARAEWDDSSFHAALEEALKGVVPDPWP